MLYYVLFHYLDAQQILTYVGDVIVSFQMFLDQITAGGYLEDKLNIPSLYVEYIPTTGSSSFSGTWTRRKTSLNAQHYQNNDGLSYAGRMSSVDSPRYSLCRYEKVCSVKVYTSIN